MSTGRRTTGQRGSVMVASASKEFLYTSPEIRGWAVRGRFSTRTGEITIEDLRVVPNVAHDETEPPPIAPGNGVSSELLRLIPVSRIKAKIARQRAIDAQTFATLAATATDPEEQRALQLLVPDTAALEAGRRTQRSASPTLPDALLRRVAIAWLEEVDRGRGAWARMLARFSTETQSVETIRRWIKRSRAEGWLAEQGGQNQGRGQLIAEPGPKLIAYRAERARRAATKETR